jgi:hypothetical protein
MLQVLDCSLRELRTTQTRLLGSALLRLVIRPQVEAQNFV